MSRLLLALALAASSIACHRVCEPGQTRACYSGSAASRAKGTCHDGVQTCSEDGRWLAACPGEQLPVAESCDGTDDDCDGAVDEGVKNACGGCTALGSSPGGSCEGCGRYTCEGLEALRCVPPAETLGDACTSALACDGFFACDASGEVVCAAPEPNACGVCGGAEVTGLGEACANDAGCAGLTTCADGGISAVCDAPARSNCGLCGEPDVADLGAVCTTVDGCTGVRTCDEAGTGGVCAGPATNACGLCGGPAVDGLGTACGSGACAGSLVCNAEGDGAVCDFPGRGDTCTGDNGCVGAVGCADDGTTAACLAPAKNLCGVCGGATLTGTLGEACTLGGCTGTLACNGNGSALVCRPDASCLPQTDHVVISELAPAGPNGDQDEFIELYNPTSAAVTLAGWKLWYVSASGTVLTLATFAPDATISAHGYYLVANGAASVGFKGTVAADLKYTGGTSLAGAGATKGGSIVLTSTGSSPGSLSAPQVVDALGYGACDTAWAEGGVCTPALPTATASFERRARTGSTAADLAGGGIDADLGNGLDTGFNGGTNGDFVVRAFRDAQSSASATEP
ncbi:MAG: hypothetical protein RL199_2312 [Pseudomonadota bacterium]|jgi:hypothetical protein